MRHFDDLSMLNKIRRLLEPQLMGLGSRLASKGWSPDLWTILSFAFAIIAAIVFSNIRQTMPFTWYYLSLTAGILLLISGFFDIIDGSVARASHRTSKRGAFMDSILDKFAETIVYSGIAFSGLVNPILCMTALSSSLLVSYTRSRAESLGVDLKGIGLAERAERLLIISLAAIVPVMNAMSYALALVLILSIITLYQRLRHTYNKLNYN